MKIRQIMMMRISYFSSSYYYSPSSFSFFSTLQCLHDQASIGLWNYDSSAHASQIFAQRLHYVVFEFARVR